METEIEVRVQCISAPLIGKQFNITKIPGLVYEEITSRYGIGTEETSTYGGQTTKWRELQGDHKVVILYSEEPDGDAIQTKLALLTWYPHEPQFQHFYQFEINGELSSGGWTHGIGNEYTEALTFATNTGENNKLEVAHTIRFYIELALLKASDLVKLPDVVRQKFIDHAPKPPR